MHYMKSFKELLLMLFCLKIKIFCNGSFTFIAICDFYIFVNVFLQFKATAGLMADSRAVVEIAREEASNYRYNYGLPIPLKVGSHRSIIHIK